MAVPGPVTLTLLVLLLVAPGLGSAAAANDAAPSPTGSGLVSPRPISLVGFQSYEFTGGAVEYDDAGVPASFELSAERIDLSFAWKNATRSTSADGSPLYQHTIEEGRQTPSFEDARVRVEPFDGQPEILAYPDGSSPSVDLEADGEQSVRDRADGFLTRVGHSRDSQQTNDSRYVGFWYEPDPTWTSLQASDQAQVAGNFSLFLNNVTVIVEDVEEGKTVWRNWTGHTRDEAAPGVVEEKRHLLKLSVTRGELSLAGDGNVDAYTPQLSVEASGVVSTTQATGQLSTRGTEYVFEDDPLRLEGSGNLTIGQANASTLDSQATDGSLGLRVEVAPSASFDVEGGQRMATPASPIESSMSWGLAGAIVLAGLVLGSLWVIRPGPVQGWIDEWRSRRYSKWMTQGRTLLEGGDYPGAAECYERAVRAKPDSDFARYYLGMTLHELGDHDEALAVVEEARARDTGIQHLDLLEVEVAAARKLGQTNRCRRALAELADGNEWKASSLARDLSIGAQEMGPELAERFGLGDDEGDLAGYA